MEHVGGRAGARLLNTMIELPVFPFGQLLRFILRQAGLHGKRCARQIQCAFQVNDFGHKLSVGRRGRESCIRCVLARTSRSGNHLPQGNNVMLQWICRRVSRAAGASIRGAAESYVEKVFSPKAGAVEYPGTQME